MIITSKHKNWPKNTFYFDDDDDDDDDDEDGDDETGGFVVSLLIGRRGNDRLNLSSPVSVPSVSAVENSGACDT